MSAWYEQIGPGAAIGAAVGAGVLKLLSLGSAKRKSDSEKSKIDSEKNKLESDVADSLYDRAVRLIEILQSQVDKLVTTAERLQKKIDDCECEKRVLREQASTRKQPITKRPKGV